MTIDRTTAPAIGGGGGRAAANLATPGKQTLVQQLPQVDPRVASVTELADQITTIADATRQLEAVVRRWDAGLDGLNVAEVGVAGASAMMLWSRIMLIEARVGHQNPGTAPLIKAARTQIARLGLRRAYHVELAHNPPELDGDPMAFIHARIAQAQECIARVQHILGRAEKTADGELQLAASAKIEVSMLLDGHPDPIEVRWIDAMCSHAKLALRSQGDVNGMTVRRLKHAQDHMDLSHKAQHDVDPELADRMSVDVERLKAIPTGRGAEARYVAVMRGYKPKDRQLLLTLCQQHTILWDMVEIAGGNDADDLLAVIRETPGYQDFAFDRQLSRYVDRSVGHAAKAIGGEMLRQAPGAITRAGAGALDTFSSIPLIGRATHWGADKLRGGSDALYDATGASKEGRGIANALSEASGALAATAVSMKVGSAVEGAAAANTAVNLTEEAKLIKDVIDGIREFKELSDRASDALVAFSALGTLAATAAFDAMSGTMRGDPARRETAINNFSVMFDAALKPLEPKDPKAGEAEKTRGEELVVVLFAILYNVGKELKNALLAAKKKDEPVNGHELKLALAAGVVNGGTFVAFKPVINDAIREFILHRAHALLKNHPTAAALVESQGEQPLKRAIEFAEEQLKVEARLQHALELVIGQLAGGHEEASELKEVGEGHEDKHDEGGHEAAPHPEGDHAPAAHA